MDNQTIYALSTVFGKSGVAIIRISGEDALQAIAKLSSINTSTIKPRYAYFTTLKYKNNILDKALVLYFKAPYSFTGEDVVELHIHGSRAVISSVIDALSDMDNFRLAEPGEFSKRAFYNQKMDLTEAEGLADLIDAETSEQQKFAIRQMEGSLKNLYESWRETLLGILAHIEAYIDFPEEDIPDNIVYDMKNTVFKVENSKPNSSKILIKLSSSIEKSFNIFSACKLICSSGVDVVMNFSLFISSKYSCNLVFKITFF